MAYPLTEDWWGALSDREALLIASATSENQEYTARLRSKYDAFLIRIDKSVAQLLAQREKDDATHIVKITALQSQLESARNANAHAAKASSSSNTTQPESCNASTKQPQNYSILQDADSVRQYAVQRAAVQLLADLDIDRPPTDAVSLKLFNAQLRERTEKTLKHMAKRAGRRQNQEHTVSRNTG